jgi:hypothetical protein
MAVENLGRLQSNDGTGARERFRAPVALWNSCRYRSCAAGTTACARNACSIFARESA